jgi:hypothetical protein
MMQLPPGYSVEVDTVDKTTWHQILETFDDANIYQTHEPLASQKKWPGCCRGAG